MKKLILALIGLVATAADKVTEQNSQSMSFKSEFGSLSVDDFRVEMEKETLYVTLIITFTLLLFLVGVSFGVVLLFVLLSAVFVKIAQARLLGSCVKVTEQQFGNIYKLAYLASKRLCMAMPDIFVVQDPIINAFATGYLGKKSIVLNSATVESMNESELLSIIGHEMTHIKAGHTDWLVITGSTNYFKIPLFSQVLGFIFQIWSRKAEYTCDRGGLIASKDLKSSVNALAKLAVGKQLFEQLNLENLFKQKEHLDKDGIARLAESVGNHPYLINRIHELNKFYSSQKYARFAEYAF